MTIKIKCLIGVIVILVVIILTFSLVCFEAVQRADKWEQKISSGKIPSKK